MKQYGLSSTADWCRGCDRRCCRDRERGRPADCLRPGHEARQIGLPLDHFFRRMPVRPLAHVTDTFGAGPSEPVASDADTVTQRLAAAEHEIEEGVRRIDHDRAGRLRGGVIDELPMQLLRQFGRTGFGLVFRRQSGDDGRAVWRSSGGRSRIDRAGDVGRAANFAWRPRKSAGADCSAV